MVRYLTFALFAMLLSAHYRTSYSQAWSGEYTLTRRHLLCYLDGLVGTCDDTDTFQLMMSCVLVSMGTAASHSYLRSKSGITGGSKARGYPAVPGRQSCWWFGSNVNQSSHDLGISRHWQLKDGSLRRWFCISDIAMTVGLPAKLLHQ